MTRDDDRIGRRPLPLFKLTLSLPEKMNKHAYYQRALASPTLCYSAFSRRVEEKKLTGLHPLLLIAQKEVSHSTSTHITHAASTGRAHLQDVKHIAGEVGERKK